jgi:hypothetical protein
MAPQNETRRAGGATGLESASNLSRCDTQILSPNPYLAQVNVRRRDLIHVDLSANFGAMSATLKAALAMRDATDDCGLIYALRRARAYWQAIAASAHDPASLQHKEVE